MIPAPLRMLPRETHSWSKFLRPSELAGGLRRQGLAIGDISGISYNPLTDSWSLTRDLNVNYMLFATKGTQPPR